MEKQTKYQIAFEKAYSIILSYPKTKEGNHFLTLKNGKKVFFRIFIKKYGLDGSTTKYETHDIYRRIKIIECFEFLLQRFEITSEENDCYIIETYFFRFVIKKDNFRKGSTKLELLSFYDI